MDPSNLVRDKTPSVEFVRYFDLLRRAYPELGIVRATALAIVLETASQGDPAVASQILRSWRIRR